MPRRLHPDWPASIKHWAAVLWLCLAAGAAPADTIIFHLKNGDRVAGVIVSEDASQVVVSNRWAKALALPLAEIARRETVSATPAEAEPKPMPPPPVPTTAVTPDTPPPPVAAAGVAPAPTKPAPRRLRGDARVGVDLLYGAKDRQIYHGRLKLTYEQPYESRPRQFFRNIFDYTAEYGRSDGEQTANRMNASNKTDFDLTEKWFVYNLIGVGYDRVRLIDLRYEAGPGLGYHVVNRTNFVFNVEGGANYQVQHRRGSDDVENFYFRLAEDITWRIRPRLTVTEKLELFPRVEDPGDFRARFEATLSYALWQNLEVNLTVLDLYESRPAPNVSKNELQIRSSLGVKF
jgi:putative salt-induced outer membrane protein YdiY